jgi:hypothetical protein
MAAPLRRCYAHGQFQKKPAAMLTTSHKASILRKAGVAVPAQPVDADMHAAGSGWAKAIETLYVAYVAARAAKSLRDAEEARQLTMLRGLAWGAPAN